MFRKPMRLEKWIAFDGALGADVLDVVANADDAATDNHENAQNEDGPREASVFGDLAVMNFGVQSTSTPYEIDLIDDATHSGTEAILYLPDEMVIPEGSDQSLPFWGKDPDAGGIKIEIPGGAPSVVYSSVFFEVYPPNGGENGSFGFFNKDSMDFNAFAQQHGITAGSMLVYVTNDVEAGWQRIYSAEVKSDGNNGLYLDHQNVNTNGIGRMAFTEDGGVRFSMTRTMDTSSKFTDPVNSLFSSLMYTIKDGAPAENGKFGIGIFYVSGSSSNNPDNYTDNGCYQPQYQVGDLKVETDIPPSPTYEPEDPGPVDPGNTGEPGDTENPGDTDDPGDNTDPGTNPSPKPPGNSDDAEDPILPPILPPVTGDGDGSGESGDVPGESENSSGGDTPGSEPGNESESGGADSMGPDYMAYIYNRDEESDAEAAAATKQGDEADLESGVVAVLEERVAETAAAAIMVELAGDLESLLTTVRGERETLAFFLGRLRDEYLLLSRDERRDLREALTVMFTMGDEEMQALARVLGQMHKRIRDFKTLPLSHHDGMLADSLRDLVTSASRLTDETSALSRAVDMVAERLRLARVEGKAFPTDHEMLDTFEREYGALMDKARAIAAKRDPMGRELLRFAMQK